MQFDIYLPLFTILFLVAFHKSDSRLTTADHRKARPCSQAYSHGVFCANDKMSECLAVILCLSVCKVQNEPLTFLNGEILDSFLSVFVVSLVVFSCSGFRTCMSAVLFAAYSKLLTRQNQLVSVCPNCEVGWSIRVL